MTMRILLSGVLLALGVCTFTRADDAKDAKAKQPAADATKDGATVDGEKEKPKSVVKQTVAQTLKMLLEKYDKDKDGKLSREERKAIREDRAKEKSQTNRTPRKRRSKRKTARPNFRARQVLAKYDKNKNGQLDSEERRAYLRDFAKSRQNAMKKLQQLMRRGNRRGGAGRYRGRPGNTRNNPLRRLQELRRRRLQQQQQQRRKRRRR
ncbi:MAG: hypothetical protein ACE5KM_12575 [Planctomycetaceae bacterium]